MTGNGRKFVADYAPALGVLLIIAIGVIIYGYFAYQKKVDELAVANEEINALQSERTTYQTRLAELENKLAEAGDLVNELNDELEDERGRNDEFEERIEDLAGTIGTLDKLAKTDPELLQKYSKVYFLNEHYVPDRLTKIDDEYLLRPAEEEHIHTNVLPRLEDLLDKAKSEGLGLKIVSAYRSFREQISLKADYRVVYGTGANAFSADQGYSEHQLGTTVDFTTPALGTLEGFGGTEAFKWLQNNAHKYGFILSYPEGNAYYEYEPWHWRFVGVDLARDLQRRGENFYDVDQREINEYLVSIFD